jgi:hypothetical protein
VTDPDQAPVWPAEPGWRVRMGAGLLVHAPLGDALREAHRKDDEREALRAERDAEMRSTAAAERLGELRMAGRVPRTPQELLADQAFAEARQDAVEARREEANADFYGKPRPSTWRRELAAAAAEREAQKAVEAETPVSVAEIKTLKEKIHAAFWNFTGKKPW